MASVEVRNMTRRPAPRLPYALIAKAILPGWDLSLVFVGTTRAKAMNTTLRRKSYVPNVLSYETGNKSGEIVICPDVAKKQAPEYGMNYQQFTCYLFIHACLHLKGEPHGTTMEQCERSFMRRFMAVSMTATNSYGPKTRRNGNRHRQSSDQGRRRRRN